ncbi:LacI family DNA-binding transcriptional regulator [Danxiaibacter flavus]|uniref:LacI family DNA-binding transcriptional regulator n=1 Tax=Danxiaibacter flavus TaxID=3049108 RepID=A0ABV3ZH54_9BACT|nr:LacI family DNA-binding transcriptional regulator [Chitinophagaceae bacterium DXS]
MKNSVTIKDISRASQVSITTVSRVLNGLSRQYRISEETQDIVKAIARELNYRPNQTAVNLRRQKSYSIGLIIPSLSNPFFSNIASIVNHELRKRGYSVILTDSGEDEQTEIEELDLLLDRQIDGLIVTPSGSSYDHIEKAYNNGLPTVCIDRYFEATSVPYVATDNYQGAYELTTHLINYGHTRIACLQGVHHVMPNVQRTKGYQQALADHGLTTYYIGGTNFSEENGYTETHRLLQRKDRPTAIFALSDTIALGAIRAIREYGLIIPKDISLVTFDNAIYLDYMAPAITSIVQPVNEIARVSIRILLDKLEKMDIPEFNEEKVTIEPKIVYRDSVAKV